MLKLLTFIAAVILGASLFLLGSRTNESAQPVAIVTEHAELPPTPTHTEIIPVPETALAAEKEIVSAPIETPTLPTPLPLQKTLENNYHVFQTFNNCGPASLSMALSYFNITITQKELGEQLRPWQIPGGNNDDKSVTLKELAEKANEFGLTTYQRPNGNIDLIKAFISNDMPIIVRTWTKENESIGHYRVIKGYDDVTGDIIQDDSLQGKNLRFSYALFNTLWEKFSYEYLILVPQDKIAIAESILGDDVDPLVAWRTSAEHERSILENDPDNIYHRFNLSVALHNIGEYAEAVAEFEKVEHALPFRTLWYQIEPIEAYFALGNYDRVLAITEQVLNRYNRAFSELYLLRGEIYKLQGDIAAARVEFEKAVKYNIHMKRAQEALNNLPIL